MILHIQKLNAVMSNACWKQLQASCCPLVTSKWSKFYKQNLYCLFCKFSIAFTDILLQQLKIIAKLKRVLQMTWATCHWQAVKNFTKKSTANVKAGGGCFKFTWSLPGCLFCCLNDNVFFCSANMVPLLHTFRCT